MKLFDGERDHWDASGGGGVPEAFVPTFWENVLFTIAILGFLMTCFATGYEIGKGLLHFWHWIMPFTLLV